MIKAFVTDLLWDTFQISFLFWYVRFKWHLCVFWFFGNQQKRLNFDYIKFFSPFLWCHWRIKVPKRIVMCGCVFKEGISVVTLYNKWKVGGFGWKVLRKLKFSLDFNFFCSMLTSSFKRSYLNWKYFLTFRVEGPHALCSLFPAFN